jgi:superfamily II DNA/RNA helicase
MQEMKAEGYHCSLLSGEMEKQARDMVVEQFRDLQVRPARRVLVCASV